MKMKVTAVNMSIMKVSTTHDSTDDQEEFPGQEKVMTEEQAAQMQEYLDSFSCSC